MAAVLLAALVLGHKSLLQATAGLLIVNAPLESSQAVSHVVIFGGDHRYDVAARLCQAHSEAKVLLVKSEPDRVERLGILPPGHVTARRQLRLRGIPEQRIEYLPGRADGLHEAVECLQTWVRRHPAAEVALLSDQFASGLVNQVLAEVLTPNRRQRIHVRALADRRFDERNWWTSRSGIKHAVSAAIRQAHLAVFGHNPELSEDDWDPDTWEQTLRGRRPEKPSCGTAHAES